MANDNVNFGSVPSSDDIGSFGENLKKMLNIGVRDFADAITRLTDGANQINKTFTQGRQRIVELQQSIADADAFAGDADVVCDAVGVLECFPAHACSP